VLSGENKIEKVKVRHTEVSGESDSSTNSEDDEATRIAKEIKKREVRKRRFKILKASSFGTEDDWQLH
jgi:hypothetical protein